MVLTLWQRVLWEVALAALALAAALLVLVPAFWIVNTIFHAGVFDLLITVVVCGVLLLLYQVRLRPTIRAASATADFQRTMERPVVRQQQPSPNEYRVWRGVPIALLRVSIHSLLQANSAPLATALCVHVRRHAVTSATLTWALEEVGGDRFLLLREPEHPGEVSPPLDPALVASRTAEMTFYHVWSASGSAGFGAPVAFATALLARTVAGKEVALQQRAIELAEQIAALPDLAGVEVMMSETDGSAPPLVLWLAAGRTRAVRRVVFRYIDPSATTSLAHSVDRYDILACDVLGEMSTSPAERPRITSTE